MFMMLMDAVAWLVVIGLGYLALIFVGAGIGTMLGIVAAAFRRKPH
jgi:hypothetical protein